MRFRRIFGLIPAICLPLILAFFNANAQTKSELSIPVYFLGKDDAITERVFLDKNLKQVMEPEKAEVFVIHNASLSGGEKDIIIKQVRSGKGLLILMGPEVRSSFLSELYGATIEIGHLKDNASSKFYQPIPGFWKGIWYYIIGKKDHGPEHWSVKAKIDWSCLPGIGERFFPVKSSLAGKAIVFDEKGKEGLIYEGRAGQGKVYLITAWISIDPDASLSRKENINYQFFCWPFFNYLLYGMILDSAGKPPPTFSEWPQAPVFPASQKKTLLLGLLIFISANVVLFFWVLRYSRKNRTALAGFEKAVYTHDTFDLKSSRQENTWADAGFYRPLTGFLLNLVITLVMIGILIPFQIWSMNNLAIFPMINGIDGLIWGVLNLLFFMFDLGISTAAVKYYSEYRAKDPQRAAQYYQFLIWWQILSGVVQVVFISLASIYLLPGTFWAYLAIWFLFYSILQWPGFQGQFFSRIFQSFQRFDYLQYYGFINQIAWIIIWVSSLYYWRLWGIGHPRFGEAFSLVFALFTIFFCLNWTWFIIGYFLYRRLGYPLKVMFLVHFKWDLIKQVVLYGYKLTIRQIIDKIDAFLWPTILAILLSNYLEVSAIIAMAIGAFSTFALLDSIHESIFPSLSEAYSNNRKKLARHYMVQALHWGFFGSVMIGIAVLILTGPISALLNPQWSQVGKLLPYAFFGSIFTFFARMPDSVFKASGHTNLIPIVGGLLLIIKVAFSFILVPYLQILGPPVVLIISGISDVVISWLLIRRYVLKMEIDPVKMGYPHILAGAIIILSLLGLKKILLPLGTPGLVGLIAVTIIMMFVPYIILSALLGGWNDISLEEFERASLSNKIVKAFWLNPAKLVKFGRSHRLLKEYQSENREEIQAEADQIVVARIPKELRAAATLTLTTIGSWKKTQSPEKTKKAN